MDTARRSVSTLNFTEGNLVVLWSGLDKVVPPDPGPREGFRADQEEFWYQQEYGVWNLRPQKSTFPDGRGASGRRVAFLSPQNLPYHQEFRDQLQKLASKAGIELLVNPPPNSQPRPDLVMINPENRDQSTRQIDEFHRAGVPVMACNYLPSPEALGNLLFWTGPDDWGQARALAREFAAQLDYQGKYAILRHVEGSSSHEARTWGVITELRKIAPLMECVAMAAPGLEARPVEQTVERWLSTYGSDLKGLVSADDGPAMTGVLDALERGGRSGTMICAAFGSSRHGLELLQARHLHCLAFQSAAIDASVALRAVVDWFSGVEVDQVRHLPVHIVTGRNLEGLSTADSVVQVHFERLRLAIQSLDYGAVYDFFAECYVGFVGKRLVSLTSLQGFGLQTIGFLLVLIHEYGLPEEELFGDYETLYRQVLGQKKLGLVIQQFLRLSEKIIESLSRRSRSLTLAQRVVEHVQAGFRDPVSLKTLAETFSINPIYLGQIFRNATGLKFTDYLAQLRIGEAQRLLRSSGTSAAVVAKEVGYTDPNYFYKVFQRLVGRSVSEFQRNPLPSHKKMLE